MNNIERLVRMGDIKEDSILIVADGLIYDELLRRCQIKNVTVVRQSRAIHALAGREAANIYLVNVPFNSEVASYAFSRWRRNRGEELKTLTFIDL